MVRQNFFFAIKCVWVNRLINTLSPISIQIQWIVFSIRHWFWKNYKTCPYRVLESNRVYSIGPAVIFCFLLLFCFVLYLFFLTKKTFHCDSNIFDESMNQNENKTLKPEKTKKEWYGMFCVSLWKPSLFRYRLL